MNAKKSSRREFLQWSGLAVTSAALAACQPIMAGSLGSDVAVDAAGNAPPSDLDPATFPDIHKLPNGFQPEGIAIGRGTDFFVGSFGRLADDGVTVIGGAIYQGDLRTGEGGILVQPQANRTAIGMAVDLRTNYLFVCGGPYGEVYVYDIATGDTVVVYRLSEGPIFSTIINDIIITSDAAYITDTALPVLYRLPLGPSGALPEQSALETIPLNGDFVFEPEKQSMNGIAATPHGQWLIVVHTDLAALFRVDPQTGATTLIDTGGVGTPGDGLVLLDHDLYVVDPWGNQILTFTMTDNFSAAVAGDPLTGHGLRTPSTAAPFGDFIYAVNARFDVALPPFIPGVDPADSNLEYEAVKLGR